MLSRKLQVLICLALTGCQGPLVQGVGVANTGVQARNAGGDLYPLEVGRRWDYQLLQRQDDGPIREKRMTVAITRVEDVTPDEVEAVMERRYGDFQAPDTRVRKRADRVLLSRLADPAPPQGPSIMILKFPLVVGDSWPGREFGGGNTETIMPRGLEYIGVPAGYFMAERLDHLIAYANGETDTLTYWYAPRVGLVKMVERITIFGGEKPIHLESEGNLQDTSTSPGSAGGSGRTVPGVWGFLVVPGDVRPLPGRPSLLR